MLKLEIKRRYLKWLDRRIPPASHITLDQKQIFILPTKGGYIWLAVVALIFILAANYANSLAFGLSFFMISLFMLSILHTWRNLAGITLVSKSAESRHAGELIPIKLLLQSSGRSRHAVKLGWPDNEQVAYSFIKNQDSTLLVQANVRGWFQPGRMRVESVYPLGFCRAWSWVQFDSQALIYPKPDFSHPLPSSRGAGDETGVQTQSGQDDFAGFRRYKTSDLSGHVDWKGYARTNELNTKLFEEPIGSQIKLSLQLAPGGGLEEKLSVLTGWCLQCESTNKPYCLSLPDKEVAANIGRQHLKECLEALALFSYGKKESGGTHVS
ncbi:hypothetical protein GZ78_26260 [Endozoicomonas numazuensis]|uniref:Uncharacterized protein n=2 Tax=Endozoicomonas numazuensis TaxID=1137799 RepID=A0A081N3P1_9GAMM|nr:hypothetical protein GZ78_27175 [Endozoicomonas numazuensis]KEQ13064.1 hypothetical protein GZ78_26260 [Endozoicomonas numazuensis]